MSCGYLFIFSTFDARDVGLSVRRPRLYMERRQHDASNGDLETYQGELQHQAKANLQAVCGRAPVHSLEEFLFDDYPEMFSDWLGDGKYDASPQPLKLAKIARKPAAAEIVMKKPATKRGASASSVGEGDGRSPKRCEELWHADHDRKWNYVTFPKDKVLYATQLSDNPFFNSLSARERDSVLINLCGFRYPGPTADLIWGLEASLGRQQAGIDVALCLVPRGKQWLVLRQRLLLGVEGLLLQGADVSDLLSLRPGVWPNAFLQNLAGNAFCTLQFAAWVISTLSV